MIMIFAKRLSNVSFDDLLVQIWIDRTKEIIKDNINNSCSDNVRFDKIISEKEFWKISGK